MALGRAASEAGFLYLQGHHIAPALVDELKAATRDFFSQDLERKMSNYIGLSANHSGYVPQGEVEFYNPTVDL